MNNRLNYSSIDDAWGTNKNNSNDKAHSIQQNWKNVNNTLPISSNEILEIKDEIKKLKEIEHFNQKTQETLKPCSLVNDHVKKCSICRNNMIREIREMQGMQGIQGMQEMQNEQYSNIPVTHNIPRNNREKINKYRKRQIEQYNDLEEEEEKQQQEQQEEDSSNIILETFENITPSQKNLLLIIIYGILIIVISDLVIKDTE
jgi:DNA-binding cell septation regulator SpoVG